MIPNHLSDFKIALSIISNQIALQGRIRPWLTAGISITFMSVENFWKVGIQVQNFVIQEGKDEIQVLNRRKSVSKNEKLHIYCVKHMSFVEDICLLQNSCA